MFIDEIKIQVRAGHGGKGCVALLREAYRPKGGPAGGDGGHGGDVILEADPNLTDLTAQYYQPRLHAEEGKPGQGKCMSGRAGQDLVVKVPCGTLVWKLSKRSIEEQVKEREALEAAEDGTEEVDELDDFTADPRPARPLREELAEMVGTEESRAFAAKGPVVNGEDEGSEDFVGDDGFDDDEDEDGDDEEDEDASPPDSSGSQIGSLTKSNAGEWAMEVDLESEDADFLDDEAELDGEEELVFRSPYRDREGELVADLLNAGERVTLCVGGRGGLGNQHFATSSRQTPRFAQPGEPGEEGEYFLELRSIAQVGLLGFPNAGKSTLLSVISNANPKIAAYPFTTLYPHVGVVEYEDYHRITVCDVPGLIEGASENVGLGHAFLRHIRRCKILAVLLDMAGTDARDPWDDYENLLRELALYDQELSLKDRLVVANKMDEPNAADNLKEFKEMYPDLEVIEMCAGFEVGLDVFKSSIRKAVEAIPAD